MKKVWEKPQFLALGVDNTQEEGMVPYQFVPEEDYVGMRATCRKCGITFSPVAEYNVHAKNEHGSEEDGYVHS